jgi:hypothetical protein
MSAHGLMTVWVGNQLQQESLKDGLTVFYDHGNPNEKNVGVISSIIGTSLQRDAKIAEIDIAILDKEKKVIFLIEIEENDDNPKKLIGDVTATIIGEKIFFKDNEEMAVGSWTTLLVFAKNSGKGHEKRIIEIEKRLNKLIAAEKDNMMKIGKVKLVLFENQDDLKKQIMVLLTPYME